MRKRLTVLLLLLSLALIAGNAAAVSGLQNDEVPDDFDDLLDIERHGLPVAGWIITGVLFIILGGALLIGTGTIGTYVGLPMIAIGIVFAFYGVIPNTTAIILALLYGGIFALPILITLGLVQVNI